MLWDLLYWLRRTPWDSGQAPPELIDLVARRFPKGGRAIDIGCGTGTNVLYLAQHGFSVLGIDVSRRAIHLARRRLAESGVHAEVKVGDVTRLDELADGITFDLALDIGCFHALTPQARRAYADALSRHVVRGGVYLLYAFCPRKTRLRSIGVQPDDVGTLFADGFLVQNVTVGEDTVGKSASAWYTLARV